MRITARTSAPQRRVHRGRLLSATIATAVVVLAAIVATWALVVRSTNTPARSVPAAISPSATSDGASVLFAVGAYYNPDGTPTQLGREWEAAGRPTPSNGKPWISARQRAYANQQAAEAKLRYYEEHPECTTPSRPSPPNC
jgi:hypothetical protein